MLRPFARPVCCVLLEVVAKFETCQTFSYRLPVVLWCEMRCKFYYVESAVKWETLQIFMINDYSQNLNRGGYSGFQVTGMIEAFFCVWNLRLKDFLGWENLASIFLDG